VWPSGGALATSCMAVTPAPPGLFSTYTLWPSCLVSSAATERATISLVPPGANGTTKRTGLAGQALCARTARQGQRGGGSTGQQLAAIDLCHGGHACGLMGSLCACQLTRAAQNWYLRKPTIHRNHRARDVAARGDARKATRSASSSGSP
jgi:hypothetical protein